MNVALVTGAARGIGAATVAALAAADWCVVAVDIATDIAPLPYGMGSKAELAAVAISGGENVVAVPADVRNLAALRDAVAVAEERWGGLDVAISAAGVIAGGVRQWELDPDVEQTVVDVNLTGTLNLARATVPALLRRAEPRQGRFIAIASTAATHGLEQLAAYCATKAGVTGLVRALSAELRGTGITANSISPGSTDTAILTETARLYGLQSVQDFGIHQSVNRLLEPAEIAAAVLFLAGATGSAITGVDWPVSGGFA